MKVLMLGWEYPPKITGGLGKACEGLTLALARLGIDLDFVVPKIFGAESTSHMRIHAPDGDVVTPLRVRIHRESASLFPYGNSTSDQTSHYSGDLFAEVDRYAARVSRLASTISFDAIHAHDWMTFPSAMAVKEATGRPLFVHVHSLERDRSPFGPCREICDIEAQGFWSADRIFAVSDYTAAALRRDYGVPREKIETVHNGHEPLRIPPPRKDSSLKKRVLFLGRVTAQKGPSYFLSMARELFGRRKDVSFVVAGDGDALPKMKEEALRYDMLPSFEFLGFLSGEAVAQAFRSADVYVMPSVSEPFGLTAVEAIEAGTPVVLSRQSGVSEVLRSAPRVDFWETRQAADLVEDILDAPEVARETVAQGRRELEHLHWDSVGAKVIAAYARVLA